MLNGEKREQKTIFSYRENNNEKIKYSSTRVWVQKKIYPYFLYFKGYIFLFLF